MERGELMEDLLYKLQYCTDVLDADMLIDNAGYHDYISKLKFLHDKYNVTLLIPEDEQKDYWAILNYIVEMNIVSKEKFNYMS